MVKHTTRCYFADVRNTCVYEPLIINDMKSHEKMRFTKDRIIDVLMIVILAAAIVLLAIII